MSTPQEPITFAPHVVCRTLELPIGTLNRWFYQGHLKHLEYAETTAGKARRFTIEDFFALAVMQRLFNLGFDPAKAAFMSERAVDAFDADPDGARTLTFREYDDGTEEVDVTGEPAKPGLIVTVTVDLHALFTDVKRRHKAVMA